MKAQQLTRVRFVNGSMDGTETSLVQRLPEFKKATPAGAGGMVVEIYRMAAVDAKGVWIYRLQSVQSDADAATGWGQA